MMVPWQAPNMQHLTPAQCAKKKERKRPRMAKEELRESAERYFQACGRLLKTVTSLKYLKRVLTAADDKWTEVVQNLRKA